MASGGRKEVGGKETRCLDENCCIDHTVQLTDSIGNFINEYLKSNHRFHGICAMHF